MPVIDVEIDSDVYLDVYKPMLDSDADIDLFWGGRDSGKTQHIGQCLIEKCLSSEYFKCILIKKTYASIEESQYDTIKDIVGQWGLDDFFEFKKAPLEIICKNGNRFIARGCDDPRQIKSIRNPTDVWYEEMDQISASDHMTIQTTLRSDRGRVKEWGSFNPECKSDYEEFYLYELVGGAGGFKSTTKTYNIAGHEVTLKVNSIHSTYKDNPYCTDERKARLEALNEKDPYYYEVYTKGKWGRPQALRPFAISFDRSKHVSGTAEFMSRKLIYLSFDFNLEPFAFIFQHKWADANGFHHVVFDEGTVENASLDDGIDQIMATYGRFRHNFIITGDKMGDKRDMGQRDKSSYYQRIRKGFNLHARQIETHPNPTHENSRDDTNYYLLHFPDFRINPKCRHLISDLETVEVDAYGKIIKANRKNEAQKADHLDGLRYSFNDTWSQKWIKAHQAKY
jgi:PBSX family phage terminase large subunit